MPFRNSLMARVMLGVLALLVAGGLIVAIASLAYGKQAARQSYDRLLLGAAQDIAESTKIVDGAPIVDLPVSAFSLLSLALDDRISYAVRDENGVLLTGYDTSPMSRDRSDQVLFDADLQGEDARFATITRRFAERDYSGTVYFTVGHTLRARNVMAVELTETALMGVGVAGLILLICAFFVIRSTMRPLEHMTSDLIERDPYDLTPMSTKGPAEVTVAIAAMNQFMRRLDRQVGAMRNLISDTAHQLRTPVAAIRAHAELLGEQGTPEQQQLGLDRLLKRTRSLGSLLDQMLSRAMVIHRTDNAPPLAIDLRDIALHVVELKDHMVLSPDAVVELVIDDDEVIVLADEISLREAVKNMLTNALKHGASPIRIGVTSTGAMGEIWVSDAGPGPSVEMLGRIGDRFERFAASKGTSAGLGLSIVNAVAEAFGGTMHTGVVDGAFRVTIALPKVGAKHEP
jgi:two-component system sensor histidine kinase TctE